MLAFSTIWLAVSLMMTLAFGDIVDKTRFVNFHHNYQEKFCQDNKTQGIYSPHHPGSVNGQFKCCRGKLLVGPFSVLYDMKAKDRSQIRLPEFTNCDYNVTIENGDDDFGTLLWKIYACKVKSILRKAEKELDFKTYVELRTTNYTKKHNGHNLQKLIRDGVKECPDGDKETVFLKKLEKYFWCFQKNEKKICEVPTTAEAQATLTRYLNSTSPKNNRTNVTCPVVPAGTSLSDNCCNGVSTPYSWWGRFLDMVNVLYPKEKLPNGTIIVKKSYSDCILTSENFTISSPQDMYYQSCHKACILNPVTFSADGSAKPEIKLVLSTAIDAHLTLFNTKSKNAIRKIVLKIQKNFRISANVNEDYFKNGTSFEDAGEALKKLTNPRDKVMLYCGYYRVLDYIMRSSSPALCQH